MTVPRGAWPRALAIATLAAALYAGSLGNDLVWDDRLTAAAPALLPQAGLWWRPVVMASFLAEHAVAGGAAWAMHLTNLVVHAGVAVLLDRLGLALGLGRGVALVAALGFAAHPVQTEAVAYVSGGPICCAGSSCCWRCSRGGAPRVPGTGGHRRRPGSSCWHSVRRRLRCSCRWC